MSDSSAYKQPEAGFPSPGPLGQPSKPAVVIADRAPLGWPTHLAVCLPLLPGCLSYLRVLSFSLCWGFEPTIQSQLGLHVANLSKRGWQRIHLSPVGLGIQQPGFVPGALYGSLGVSLVSQQSCMTWGKHHGVMHARFCKWDVTSYGKQRSECLTPGIWERGQLFAYTSSWIKWTEG